MNQLGQISSGALRRSMAGGKAVGPAAIARSAKDRKLMSRTGRVTAIGWILSSTRCRKGYRPMEFTRNRYFMTGMLLILLGVQFRMVQSFVLNEPATRTLVKLSKNAPAAANNGSSLNNFFMQVVPHPKKQVVPPRWLGLAMVAVGAVISLHALAMPRQG